MTDSFGLLPNELILYISILLSSNCIVDICLTNSGFKKIVLDDEIFGIEHYERNWETLYRSSIDISVFGSNFFR
jgi:hypothetical protein